MQRAAYGNIHRSVTDCYDHKAVSLSEGCQVQLALEDRGAIWEKGASEDPFRPRDAEHMVRLTGYAFTVIQL